MYRAFLRKFGKWLPEKTKNKCRENVQSSKIPDACGWYGAWKVYQIPWLSARGWVAFAIKGIIPLSYQVVQKVKHVTQISFKGQSGVAGINWPDWNSNTVTWESVNSGDAQPRALRVGAKIRSNHSARSRLDTSWNVVSFTARQPGQLLAGVTNLAPNGSSASKTQAFTLCPVSNGGCAAMSGTAMDPGNGDVNLGGASSTNSFILVVSSENNPDSPVSSFHCCFHCL